MTFLEQIVGLVFGHYHYYNGHQYVVAPTPGCLARGFYFCPKTTKGSRMAARSRDVQIKIFAKKHIDYNFTSHNGQIIQPFLSYHTGYSERKPKISFTK